MKEILNNTICEHLNVTFHGAYSMIGSYRCNDCKITIDPVIFAINRNRPNVLFHPNNKKEFQEYMQSRSEDQIKLIQEDKLKLLKNSNIL